MLADRRASPPEPPMGADRPIPSGVRYVVPHDVLAALEQLFCTDVARVAVVYRPWYVRAHLMCIGGRRGSVTRPERIYTNLTPTHFFALDRHVLHEYYHVVQQWRRERMTRVGYLLDSPRREREACEFAERNLERYRRYRELAEARYSNST